MQGATPGTNQSHNRKNPTLRPEPDCSGGPKSKTTNARTTKNSTPSPGMRSARGVRPRSGSANVGVVGGLGSLAAIAVNQGVGQRIDQAALDAYYAGDRENRPGLYYHGQCLHDNMMQEEYRERVLNGQDPDVEALPWWQRWLRKMSSSAAQSYDNGLFMSY